MEHLYHVEQAGPYTWGAVCLTHQRAAVATTEKLAEKKLLKKCAGETLSAPRVVDTRSDETKMRDWYGAEEVGEDLGSELE